MTEKNNSNDRNDVYGAFHDGRATFGLPDTEPIFVGRENIDPFTAAVVSKFDDFYKDLALDLPVPITYESANAFVKKALNYDEKHGTFNARVEGRFAYSRLTKRLSPSQETVAKEPEKPQPQTQQVQKQNYGMTFDRGGRG